MLKRSGFDSENGESRSWKRKHILYTCVPRKPRFAFLCSKEALGRGLISCSLLLLSLLISKVLAALDSFINDRS